MFCFSANAEHVCDPFKKALVAVVVVCVIFFLHLATLLLDVFSFANKKNHTICAPAPKNCFSSVTTLKSSEPASRLPKLTQTPTLAYIFHQPTSSLAPTHRNTTITFVLYRPTSRPSPTHAPEAKINSHLIQDMNPPDGSPKLGGVPHNRQGVQAVHQGHERQLLTDKAQDTPTRKKKKRNRIYILCKLKKNYDTHT